MLKSEDIKKLNNTVIDDNIDNISLNALNNDNIILIQQYYINSNVERKNELDYCLKRNINSNYFSKIILLNEQIYTKEQMNLSTEEYNKIIQVNIKVRLNFGLVLEYIANNKDIINGYVVFSNNDIFFDDTINYLRHTTLSIKKGLYALLIHDIKNMEDLNNLENTKPRSKLLRIHGKLKKILTPVNYSQDTWILHTNQLSLQDKNLIEQSKLIDFGINSCDNKIAYIFKNNGFTVYNMYKLIKTYHYHITELRTYEKSFLYPFPYLKLKPINKTFEELILLDN